jgi:lysine 2,3-aminomutase
MFVSYAATMIDPLETIAIGPRSDAFRQQFFGDATASEWNDWRWQLRHRITGVDTLARLIHLTDDERCAMALHGGLLPVGITPYYASLLEDDASTPQPIRRTVVMVGDEHIAGPGEALDPLGEDDCSPVPGLVHRYPDRVLFLVTGTCAVYCRYCTRARVVGKPGGEYRFSTSQWQRAIDYVAATPTIRDVLISGGDPLVLSDDRLEWLLRSLRAIPHVEFLRIGTKVPTVLPQRITASFTRMLRRYHPLWMSIHFMHPSELTPEVGEACERLADAGLPLGSQTVLLAGVNDDAETLKSLFHGLLRHRVRPYYLYQCDPIVGSAHLRVPVEKGLAIMSQLRGYTTGYAVPHYVVDAPGGGGKIPLVPGTKLKRHGDFIQLTNYEGRTFQYPDNVGEAAAVSPSPTADSL